jgi:aerobic carbon-monoxide dehydrogenase small subunit
VNMSLSSPTTPIRFQLNGREVTALAGSVQTLLDLLRQTFGLYGARESCGQGVCGSCTIVVDGRAVSSCLYWAALADGAEIVTIEGLGSPSHLDPVQEAFIEEGAFQCGYCTPGMVMMVHELLRENPRPTEEQIRSYLSGNICRCAAYPQIIEAVLEASAHAAERRNT